MLKTNLLFALAASLGLGSLHATAPSLLNLVSADAPAVLSISSVPAMRKAWPTSATGRLWNDPQIVKFLAPLRAKMEIDQWDTQLKQEIGMTLSEVLDLAQGDAVIALNSLDFALGDTSPKAEDVPFLIAVNISGKSDEVKKLIAELLTKQAAKPEPSNTYETEDFNGVAVTTVRAKKADGTTEPVAAWAVTSDALLISPSKQQILSTIDALKNGGAEKPLAKNERFLALRERAGDSSSELWINLQAIYPIGQQALVKATSSGQPNAFLPNPAGILSALGLDALQELYISSHATAEKGTAFYALTWSEKRGLLKFLATKPGLPELPNFLPARSPNGMAANLDLNAFWPTLKEIVGQISPAGLGLAQGQIMAYNQKLNVDLERGIFGSFAPGIYSAYVLPPGTTGDQLPGLDKVDQIFAINLSDSAAFGQSVEALKSLMGENVEQFISKRDYLGQTIYTVIMPQAASGGKGMSYAITPKTLILGIGSPSVIETALQGLAGDAPSFFQQDWVKTRLAQIPPNANTAQLSDLPALFSMLSNMIVDLIGKTAKPKAEANAANDFIDLSAKPDLALFAKYFGYAISYSYEETDGYFTRATVDYKP